jgi:hypothetical protein
VKKRDKQKKPSRRGPAAEAHGASSGAMFVMAGLAVQLMAMFQRRTRNVQRSLGWHSNSPIVYVSALVSTGEPSLRSPSAD